MKKARLVLTLTLLALLFSGCTLSDLVEVLNTATSPDVRGLAATNVPAVDRSPEYELESYEAYTVSETLYSDAMMPMGTSMPLSSGYADSYNLPFNTEEYAALTENGFRTVVTSPLSTFSADVDTASYCNLRRMLNAGYTPNEIPSGAVRIEEMLNYFRYDYSYPEGNDRFSVNAELAPCPWNPETVLLMLGVRAADRVQTQTADPSSQGSNLVFLIDVSGSMNYENKLGLVKKSLYMLLDKLGEKDTVSVVTYSAGERILIEGASPTLDKVRLMSAIEELEAAGYTDGQHGLAQAYEVAQRYFRPNGNNRVIMCSDGDLNVGITSQSDLHDYVSEKRRTGIYLSVLGFGEGNYKDTKMETLADDGNGNYYYIDSILEARKVLVEEMTQTLYTVADDVKFQIEFNPARVLAYRQVGYENRALENADFVDDKKDAGEVGSGAYVTVLYELIPENREGNAQGNDSLRYQQNTLTDAAESGEWLSVSIRYKEPGAAESQLMTVTVNENAYNETPSGDMKFAAAVAEFGMLLKDSEYKGKSSFDSVIELLKLTPLSDDYREEFFSLVKIAERAEKLER